MKYRPCILRPALGFDEARKLSRNFTDHHALPKRTSSVALGLAGPIRKWRTDFLFDYAVFPPSIIRYQAEWQSAGRRMAVGDLILQRALMPPVGFGLCLEFAVRICALFDEEKRLGFSYETLSGHAESGVSEFYFEERAGELSFTIHTFSQPGHWTSRLAKHFFTLPYQAWCTQRALTQVRRRFHDVNQEPSVH